MNDKSRILKAIAYIEGLSLDCTLRDTISGKVVRRYGKFRQNSNNEKARNAVTLLRNTDLMKGKPECTTCKGTGKVKCYVCIGEGKI